MRRPPSIKQLEAFLVIEALRNVTSAAARLHVSQPALSRTLRLMEEDLETPLFKRSTRVVELTAAGTALLPVAKRLVGEYYESFGDLGNVLDGQAGRVVLAGLPSVVVALMPGALRGLAAIAPHVEVKVLGLPEQQVLAAVRDGTADFAVVTQPAAAEWFRFEKILVDEYVLLCRRDDPLARKKVLPWTTLASRPFIGFTHASSVRPTLDRAFIQMGLTVNVKYEVDHLSLIGAMVAAGLGLSVLPRLALALIDCAELASIALQGRVVERVIGSLQRVDTALSPAAAKLREALFEEVHSTQGRE
ncbi:LysR family transcriptional regulator [Variovorax sp. M-6]|uniref:LysR family transcriptional regulator n=1 Tax=Variovorax sp. M-6 TaxID=3233041 RepID=UPI003F9824BE